MRRFSKGLAPLCLQATRRHIVFEDKEIPTIIEYIDGIWSSIWGFFDHPSVGFLEGGAAWLKASQQIYDIHWAALLCGFGFAVRLSTLAFSLYGERAAIRMQLCLPELAPHLENFQSVYYDASATSKEIQMASETFKSKKRELFAKHDTSNLRGFTSVLGSPALMSGLFMAANVATDSSAMLGSSLAWLPSLAVSDPFFILPVTATLMTVLNMELALSSRHMTKKGLVSNIRWTIRGAAICVLPLVVKIPAAVLLYWIGIGLGSLLQPLLMRSDAFRRWFKVPEVNAVIPDPVDAQLSVASPQMVRNILHPERAAKLQEERIQYENNPEAGIKPKATTWKAPKPKL